MIWISFRGADVLVGDLVGVDGGVTVGATCWFGGIRAEFALPDV